MPFVSDFVMIKGDEPIRIGDGRDLWEAPFNTGGRSADHHAFLIFNVKGLTHTNLDVRVRVNGIEVGKIYHYGGRSETAEYWFTQMIAMQGQTLNDGDNEIEIRAVSWPGATADNLYDDFYLKDVFCFFHQFA